MGFVAFNLSAFLQGSVLWPCHLDFIGMTLAAATESSKVSHICGVNCICRTTAFQAQVSYSEIKKTSVFNIAYICYKQQTQIDLK